MILSFDISPRAEIGPQLLARLITLVEFSGSCHAQLTTIDENGKNMCFTSCEMAAIIHLRNEL